MEDAHSASENTVYWYLWRAGRHIRASKSRFVQIGYALISKGVGLDRTNVQNILRTLESKLAIRIVTPGTVRASTVYEVFSCDQILNNRREAGLLWVQRYGSRRVNFIDESGDLLTPIGLAPIGASPPVGDTPIAPMGVTPTEPVGATPTQLVREQNYKQTSSASIAEALSQYATADDDAARKLIAACRAEAPDCEESEILHFVHQKALLLRSGRINSPLGFLLSSVPKCFQGDAFQLYRNRREETRRRATVQSHEETLQEQEWIREQEEILADPNSAEEDKRFARQILGME
jgi:hypothetical protein